MFFMVFTLRTGRAITDRECSCSRNSSPRGGGVEFQPAIEKFPPAIVGSKRTTENHIKPFSMFRFDISLAETGRGTKFHNNKIHNDSRIFLRSCISPLRRFNSALPLPLLRKLDENWRIVRQCGGGGSQDPEQSLSKQAESRNRARDTKAGLLSRFPNICEYIYIYTHD